MSGPASASDAYDKAEDFFKDDNFATAATWYDKAIELAPTNARYLSNRAQNSIKLKRFQAALDDAQAALAIEPTNGRTLMRKGQALFYLDRFQEAQAALEAAAQAGQEKTELWLRKCKAELERAAAGPTPVTVAATAASATAPVVHKIDALPKAAPEPKPEHVLPKAPANLAERTREQWFQGPTDVTVTVLAKNLKPDQVQMTFESETNTLSIALDFPADGSQWRRTWQLWGQVAPGQQPTMNLTAYKVEVVLQKAGSETWDRLERQSGGTVAPIVKRENVHREDINYAAYPTSSKTLKDWTEVEAAAKKAEEEEKPEGEAALQKMFQSIYSGADEDTRRAMIKSFQTSGGTVLSTNWKDVKDKNYEKEVEAPKGMEAKAWNSRDRGAV